MKFLAVLLIGAILLLSSQFEVKAVAPAVKNACCKHMAGKACHQKSAQKDDCSKPGCNMMFTCSICGFLTVEPLRIEPAMATQIEQLAPTYKTGHLQAWCTANWKPPQAV